MIFGKNVVFVFGCFIAIAAMAASAEASSKVVDSGSFGVFVNGTRVATEKFQIQQNEDGSIAKSEFKTEKGEKSSQKAELEIAPNGNLRRYTWNETSPGKAEEVVEPADQFLVEHIRPNPPEKPQEQPYILPISTMIMDDYFFSQREILIWRYLAESCGGTISSGCKLQRTQFGILIPRQRTSAMLTIDYAGKENVTVRGVPQQLDRFNLTSEGEQWAVYLDQSLKVQRITIASEHTEIVRD